MEKELETLNYIEQILLISNNPICMCSFGKDSMVMLYLIRKIMKDLPVLFMKEPFFPKKYKFANRIIEEWNLTVYDYYPIATDFIYRNNDMEIINWYNGYGNALLYLPTGICNHNGEFICAISDLLNKPKVTNFKFPWDTIFVGHKNNDIDPILGHTTLKERTVKIQQMTLALPIIDWSDKDIWDYAIKNHIPYNDKRYDKNNNFREFEDKTYNNDYHPCCKLCLDNKEPEWIKCPKSGNIVKNISQGEEDNKFKLNRILGMMGYLNSN